MFFVVLLLSLINSSSLSDTLANTKPNPTPFQDWDYIVYSQRWPITACSEWKERSSKNTCNLPRNDDIWTVHGVWPTKIGEDGPFFCNSAIHFDPDQLQPMMPQLQEFWPNIEANTKPNSFWKHEWSKHGTCASTLPQLDSVTNFFMQGLQWNQDYKLADMLAKFNIIPNVSGYNISDIFNAIRATTGKNPTVECVVDGKSKQSLINEIRICFNKDLDLIDCNVTNVMGEGDVFSNCNAKDNVMYYAVVPNNTYDSYDTFMEIGENEEPSIGRCLENLAYERTLLKIYNIVKFLMWFTL